MATNLTGLPEGFIIDQPDRQAQADLPAGFEIDRPAQQAPSVVELLSGLGGGLGGIAPTQEQALAGSELVGNVLQTLLPAGGSGLGALGGAAAGTAIAPGPGTVIGAILGGAGGAGLGETTKQGIEIARQQREGIDPAKIGLEAAFGAGGEALGFGGQIVARKAIEKAAPVISKLLASVPEESTARVVAKELAGDSILRGKIQPEREFKELGQKALKAIRETEKQLGKNVGETRKLIAGSENIILDARPVSENIIQRVKDINVGGVQVLEPQDMKIINEVAQELASGDVTPAKLLGLKSKIQNATSFSREAVSRTTNQGDFLLNEIRKDIDNVLVSEFPELRTANTEFARLQDSLSVLKNELKNKNIARTLRTVDTDANIEKGVTDAFETLDDLMPENKKFLGRARDVRARQDFQGLLPVSRGANRSEQEVINLLVRGSGAGALGAAALGPAGAALGPLALPLIGPRAQGAAIRALLGGPQIPVGAGAALGGGAPTVLNELLQQEGR